MTLILKAESTNALPQVYLLPWVALLVVGHTGLQLGFYAKSDIVTSGWLSVFLPNNFRSLTYSLNFSRLDLIDIQRLKDGIAFC